MKDLWEMTGNQQRDGGKKKQKKEEDRAGSFCEWYPNVAPNVLLLTVKMIKVTASGLE